MESDKIALTNFDECKFVLLLIAFLNVDRLRSLLLKFAQFMVASSKFALPAIAEQKLESSRSVNDKFADVKFAQ